MFNVDFVTNVPLIIDIYEYTYWYNHPIMNTL